MVVDDLFDEEADGEATWEAEARDDAARIAAAEMAACK